MLTPQEVDDLFVILRQMAREGHALIFISHKLHEVLAISQRVTVLRDGRWSGTRPTEGDTKAELARMMVGREVLLQYKRPPASLGAVRLEMRAVCSPSDRGTRRAARRVAGGVRRRNLGLAGVSGNGQRELAEAMAGLRPWPPGHDPRWTGTT